MFRKGIASSICLLLVVLASCGAPHRAVYRRNAPSQPPPPPSVNEAKAYIGGTDGYYHGQNCPELSSRNRQCEAVSILAAAGYRPCPTCNGRTLSLVEVQPAPRVEVEPARALPPPLSPRAGLQGQCVGVADGDTISVMHNGREDKIRLFGIDCPEGGQAYGRKAKQYTSSLVFGKTVQVEVKDRDQYGRTVGMVTGPDGSNVNYAIVAAGLAWWYRQYAPGDATFERLETEARLAKRGLWADPHAVPPWDYRRGPSVGASPRPRPHPEPPATAETRPA